MGGGKKWTPAEDAIVRERYPDYGPSWPGWAEVLKDRTPHAIGMRASKLGVRYDGHAWTALEDRIVLAAALRVSRETGRSVCAIGGRLTVLAARAHARARRAREQGGGA